MASIILLWVLGSWVPVTAQQNVAVRVQSSGSVPQIAGLYDCIWHLAQKPYSAEEANVCLQSIAETKYFNIARLKTRRLRDQRLELTFELGTPPAIVQEMKIVPVTREEGELKAWLDRNPRRLRIGRPYTAAEEISTRTGIERFYGIRGYAVGISSTVNLDYRSRSARVEFKITKGPTQPSEPSLPPYEDLCNDHVGALDWSGVSQEVPLPLVLRIAKLHSIGSCFSDAALEKDRIALETLGLFTHMNLSDQGPPSYRQISVALRSEPIPIDKVEVTEVGLDSKSGSPEESTLPLRPGDVYARAKAEECVKTLQAAFKSPERRVAVFEREALTPEKRLVVGFDVLVFPESEVFINGEPVFPKPVLAIQP